MKKEYRKVEDKLRSGWGMKKEYRKVEDKLRSASIIKEDEEIVGVVEEVFYRSTLPRVRIST